MLNVEQEQMRQEKKIISQFCPVLHRMKNDKNREFMLQFGVYLLRNKKNK